MSANSHPSSRNDGRKQGNSTPSTEPQLTGDNTIKNPDDWTTGDEPMTGAQRSYLSTLASEAGEEATEELSKAEASKKIDELRKKTGKGE